MYSGTPINVQDCTGFMQSPGAAPCQIEDLAAPKGAFCCQS